MSKFNVNDRVVVSHREDVWDGRTGTVKRVDNDFAYPLYIILMDNPKDTCFDHTCMFFEYHLELLESADTDNIDYEASAHIVKNYMEDERKTSISEDDLGYLLVAVLEADLDRQGYSESTCKDRARDLQSDIELYLDTIRP